jgi:uncharacterized membrane protein YkvA (DUF1232 family)
VRETSLMNPSWLPGWSALVGFGGGLVFVWLTLLLSLWITSRSETIRIGDALRLLPDVIRLAHGLARDRSLPRGVRVRLWLLLAYLALPIDLVPDFIPVIGYADDAIAVVVTLRSITRTAGPAAIERHWPGTADGLAAVLRLARLPE